MILEPITILESPFARINIRVKIIFAVLFSFTVALAYTWQALAFALFSALLLIRLTRIAPMQMIKRLLPACGFLLFLCLVLPFTISGSPVWSYGPLMLTQEGILLAGQIILKSLTILTIFMALAVSTTVSSLGQGLQQLWLPEKLVYLLLFCYRYIFVIEQEYRRLEKAIQLRCFKAGTNLHTYRTYAYLVGMLFVRSFLRADQVHKAMLCRGFQGRFFCLDKNTFRRQDRGWVTLFSLIILVLVVLEWKTHLF